jgi:GT2 family glycosyltransferase
MTAGAAAVGVVVVNYNGGELVARCARAVLASTGVELELAVSDNGSRDGSLQAMQLLARQDARVKVITNGANLGFAAGCNRALPLLNPASEFILFLNPDCIVEPTAIALMADAMREHPGAGIAGCLIRNVDGSEQRGCRRLMPTPASALVRVLKLDRLFPGSFAGFDLTGAPMPAMPVEVQAISGAFMFVRRSAFDVVGPLDESYFLHCEDLDWCMRFALAGWKILFVPGAIATHAQGASSKSIPVRVEWHKHQGMLRFYSKFQRKAYGWPLYALVVAGVWLRFTLKAAWLTARRAFSR